MHSRKILGTEIFTHIQGLKYPIHAKFLGTEILTHVQGPKYPIHATFLCTEILTLVQGPKYIIHVGTEIPTHDQGAKYRSPTLGTLNDNLGCRNFTMVKQSDAVVHTLTT